MRTWIVALVAAAFAAGATAALAGGGSYGSDVSGQYVAWVTAPSSTSTHTWKTLSQLSDIGPFCNLDAAAEAVSLNVKGAPVDFRVVYVSTGSITPLTPSPAHFAPGSTTSFSFTFVMGPVIDNQSSHLDVQWRRSSSSGTATLQGGSAHLLPSSSHCG